MDKGSQREYSFAHGEIVGGSVVVRGIERSRAEEITEAILRGLATVPDDHFPEFSVLDFRLLRGLRLARDENAVVTLTLTTPDCPFRDKILQSCGDAAFSAIEKFPEIAGLDLDFQERANPPWSVDDLPARVVDRVAKQQAQQMIIEIGNSKRSGLGNAAGNFRP